MITRKEFTEQVERLIIGNRTDVMSAILKVCEVNNVEPEGAKSCLLYTSPSPRDKRQSRMPSSA